MSNAKWHIIENHIPSSFNYTGCPVILRDASIAWPNLGSDGKGGRVFTVQRGMVIMSDLLRAVQAGGRVLTAAFGNDATMERIEREKYGPRTVTYLGLPGA